MDELLRDFPSDTGDRAARTGVLAFRAGRGGVKTLSLDAVRRIETARSAGIARSPGRLVLRRDDGLPALLPLVRCCALRHSAQPVLIVEICGYTFGLLIDEIIGVADAGAPRSGASHRTPGDRRGGPDRRAHHLL